MWPAYGHYGLSLADGSASRPVNQLLRTRLRQEGARLPRPNTSATGLTVLANAVALPPWPSDACEHRIGERMARVAHSIMTYFQRNPGIKRKSKSTHHHPESPMCIDPPGCTWEQAPDHNSPWKTPESRGNMAFASYYRFLPCATSGCTAVQPGGPLVRPCDRTQSLGYSVTRQSALL